MKPHDGTMIKVKAGDLAEALKPAKPHPLKKRPKPLPVSLEHELVAGRLQLSRQSMVRSPSLLRLRRLACPVQVDGVMLYRLVPRATGDRTGIER